MPIRAISCTSQQVEDSEYQHVQGTVQLNRVRTLEEVLQLAGDSLAQGRPVGVYIETKGPTYHENIGLPLESKLADALVATWEKAAVPVILQSFEVEVSQHAACLQANVHPLMLYRQQ